jgi:hypothetical protein
VTISSVHEDVEKLNFTRIASALWRGTHAKELTEASNLQPGGSWGHQCNILWTIRHQLKLYSPPPIKPSAEAATLVYTMIVALWELVAKTHIQATPRFLTHRDCEGINAHVSGCQAFWWFVTQQWITISPYYSLIMYTYCILIILCVNYLYDHLLLKFIGSLRQEFLCLRT